MGYAAELWAVDPARVVDELTTPTLTPDHADTDLTDPEVVERWDECAAMVRDAIAEGGAQVAGALAAYVHVVLKTTGHFYGALDHTSAGGDEFRDDLLAGTFAATYGETAAAHLTLRSVAGLTWFDRPWFGWLDATEVRAALDHADRTAADRTTPSDHVEPLRVLDAALRRCARFDLGLVAAHV
jgi:hypothetical protein